MPSGFRPINDPRQTASSARGTNSGGGGFRVVYAAEDLAQEREAQRQQQQPRPQEDGWMSRALQRGTGGAISGISGLLEELPQAVTAGVIDTGARLIGQTLGIPTAAIQPASRAFGNVAAGEVDRQIGTQYRSAVAPVTTAMKSTGQRMVQEAGPAVTQSSDVTNLPGSFSEVPDYLGRVGQFAAERTLESAPIIGASLATTALTRSPTAGRVVLGGLGAGQTYTGIREQQEKAGVTDYARAFQATAASTALDLIAGTGKAVTSVGKEAGEGIFKTAIKTAKEEAPTEVAQTLFERYGGYQDLTSREAVDDYIGSFIAGFAGGGAFGGLAGATNKIVGPKEQADKAVDDESLIKGEQETSQGSDVAGGIESGDTVEAGTKKAEPVREPQIMPTDVVKGLFNEGNVTASLSNTGIAPKYLPQLSKRLASAFQSNNEKELDSILKAQERRLDPAHSSVKSDEDLARNQAVHGAVSQLIGNFREFHGQALLEEDLLTGPSEVARYVMEKNKQQVAKAKEAQLRNQQAGDVLAAQQQEAELNEQQRVASEAAAREQEMREAAKRVEAIHRQGILQTVVSDPETRDPMKRFSALLKRNNFDPNISEEEAKALEGAIAKLEQKTAGEAAKSGMSVQEYKASLPTKALREAENLGMTPEQYTAAKTAADDMGISVAAFVQMQQERQLATPPAPTQAPAKAPFFELEAQRELGAADIAAMERAQAKRDRKAERDAAKMAEQAQDNRDQLSFLTEGAPAPAVVEGKKVVTPAKTGIKQRFDVGKKAAEAAELKARALRAKAEAEAAAAAKKAPAKKKAAKRPALPKDKAQETKPVEAAKAAKRPALPKDTAAKEAPKKEAPKKEKKSAAEKRKKPQGGVSERVRASKERQTTEAGRGNRTEPSRTVKEKAPEKVTSPETEKQLDKVYDLVTELNRRGLVNYAKKLRKDGVIDEADLVEIERMSKDKDMGPEDIGNELRSSIENAAFRAAAEPQSQLTYEDVLKEAETYLAEDGESGLLKPTEYQQLSMLAEQGKLNPTELRERLDAVVNSRAAKAIQGGTLEAEGKKTSVGGNPAAIRDVLDVAKRTGKAVDVLKSLSKRGGFIGRAASRMAKVIGDVDVVVMSRAEYIKWRTARGLADRPTTKTAAGEYFREDGKVYLVSDMKHERVPVHELGHAITVNAIDGRTPEGIQLEQLYDKYKQMASEKDSKRYGLRNTYEFVAEIWSNKNFRSYLAAMQYSGTDMLSRFKRIFVRITGMPIGDVARVLEVTEQIARRESEERSVFRGDADLLEAQLDETVASKNMPEGIGSYAKSVGKRFLSATDENLSVYGFTENLIEDAQKLIPSTKKYLVAMRDRLMKKEELTRQIDGIRSKFVALGLKRQGVGKGTLNGFLQDTVNSEKWGFQPEWLGEVEIDPALADRFNALPAAEQAIVKEALKTSYDTLKTKIDTVIEAVNNNYESLILKAMDQNDEKKVAKLEQEQKNALAEYRGLFAARKDKPYITTRRFGDYMVVAKSEDLHSAVELGDKKLIEEMKGQEDHYFVQRYDTLQEARAARQKLMESGAFKGGTVVAGEVDKTYQQFVGGRDMMVAYDRLRKLIQNQVEALDENNKVNAKVIANMERLAVDLQLLALKQTSARKSELRKLGVGGGDMDMMRNFVAQGAADAHMISSLMYSKKIDEAIDEMRKEAFSDFNAEPEKARRFYNELMLRHASGMAYEHSNMAETIKTATSMMMLSLSPSYYLTNMTQPWVLSVPYMAGEHSYAKVNAEMLKSYGEVAKAWGEANVLQPLELDKVSADVRGALEELANRGRIDIGVDKEIGEFHSLKAGAASNLFDKTGSVIRALSQKVESINRVSTAAAAYRLAKESGKTHEQAVEYADKVIRATHGTYDGFNAPRWMRGPVLSTITQFKKFQLMQVTLLWKLFKNSLAKGDSTEAKLERAVARRQLGFTMWHTVALAGLRGLPGMTAATFLWNLIVGAMDDDDEPEDIEQQIRDAIGKDYAELLLTGAPSLAGIDISDRIGMGQAFSIIPYTDIKFSREGFYTALAGLLGPGAALVGKAGDAAAALQKNGDFYDALGKLLPNGLDDGYAAFREATKGVKSGGDVVIEPEDIDFGQTFARTMGIMTTERAARLRESNRQYDLRDAFKRRSGQITRDYIEAKDAKDTKAQADARAAWKKLQAERKAAGERVQPLSNLLRAYKARNTKLKSTVKGVQYSPRSEALRRAQEEAAAEEAE